MIRLTRAVVAARPWHALALLLLGALAIGAAVAAPAYSRMAQASVAATDIANTPATSLLVSTSRTVKLHSVDPQDPTDVPDPDPLLIPKTVPAQLRVRGFAPVFDTTVFLAGGATFADYFNADDGYLENTILSYRSDSCAHVVVVSGRCVAAPLEVMVSESTAKVLRGGVGATMQIQYTYSTVARFGGVAYLPAGPPHHLSVVGVFRTPADLSIDAYWAGSAFAGVGPETLTGLIGPDTIGAVPPYVVDESYRVYPLPGALAPDKLANVQADVTASSGRLHDAGQDASSELPDVLDRIALDQRRVAVGPAAAGLPLVLLCWFVIFLAVTETAQARRPELALLKLRGASTVDRWWLSAAESVVPLLLGSVVGFFAGHGAVRLLGGATLAHPGPVQVSTQSLLYGAAALVGALLAGLAALRRDLSAPVVELMRRVARRRGSWSNAVITAGVVTLAAVGVFESRDSPSEDPTALVLLGPALVVLAVGLLLAGVLDPLAERVGVAALRRGRLGLGLAALQIGRPRNSRRVVALLTIAVGLFVFAVTANDVSVRARDERARLTLGAPRVLTVQSIDPAGLLAGVRQVDPTGAYAMAVEAMPAAPTSGGPLLAVDSTRLPGVAYWPGPGSAADVVKHIRPTLADPVVVRGTNLLVDATFVPSAGTPPQELSPADRLNSIMGLFAPLAGGATVLSTEAPLLAGAHTYRLQMPCALGCRLTALNPHIILNTAESEPSLVLSRLRTGDGGTTLVTPEQFGGWLDDSRGQFQVTADAQGLKLQVQASTGRELALVRPGDQTAELPVVAPEDVSVRTLPSQSGNFYTSQTGTAAVLPRVATTGGIGDLEVAIRDGVILRDASAEVWLNAAAPPDIVDRLGKAGLPVVTDRSIADVTADAGQRPNALGWRFFVILGALALVLGIAGLLLAATVERRPRAYALRAMRAQGVAWRTVSIAGLLGYLAIVMCGLIFGAGAALFAWWLDGSYLPIVEGRPLGQSLPGWPGPVTVGWWGVATAALVVVAIGVTMALARVVRSGRRDYGGGSA